MKAVKTISIYKLLKAVTLAFMVEKPPVETVQKAWHTESNGFIPPQIRKTTSIDVSDR